MRKNRRLARVAAVGLALTLVAAACGDDDDDTAGEDATTTAAAAETTAAPATTAGGAATTAGGGEAGPCVADDSIDAEEGKGAGQFVADILCSQEKPLKAEGDPIIIGFQNPEGDPNGSFPEFTLTAQATVDYINNELGGLGSDLAAGKPGRPIQLEVCKMAINPADSQKCANELASKEPFTVVSSLNFFGNHFPIYAQAGVSVIVGTPITVGDFTTPNVFSIGSGGGCLGAHTGVIKYAAVGLGAKRIAVPWADTPPGVVCYYDLEAKPLDVLKGVVPGDSELAGTIPDLEHIGVPIKPATPDLTPQITQILDFEPEAIVFSAQGADCINLISALGRLGWTPDAIPLVMTGACIDIAKLTELGDLAKGIYFQGAAGGSVLDCSQSSTPRLELECNTYNDKMEEYGVDRDQVTKGFATQGFFVLMTIWEQVNAMVKAGEELTPDNFVAWFGATSDVHSIFSVPFGCADAPEPYVSVCAKKIAITRWTGETFETVENIWDGTDLIAGTELKPGP